jgi:fatty acid desaturase
MKHHKFTLHKECDLEVVLPEHIYPWHWFFFATILPFNIQGVPGIITTISNTVKHSFRKLDDKWEHMLFPDDQVEELKKMFNWARFMLIGHIVLAALFIATGNWILVFIVNLPVFIAPWLAILCNLPQHIGLKPEVQDYRICCRTNTLSPILSFFYFNMNYHTEHHMYAGVPFYNLPQLHYAIKDDLPEVKHGLLATWKEIMPIVKRQRTEPDFCLVQKVPV